MTTRGWRKPACKRGHINPERTKAGGCIKCAKEYRAETYERTREDRIRRAIERAKEDPVARRDQQRAHRLGVPVAKVREAIERCAGRCEACGLSLSHDQMCVDHCHDTGRVRGVLCRFCNALEGMLNKKPERVEQVMAYVAMAMSRAG